MSATRTTNLLLLVIAACLVALSAKQLLPGLIPDAKAAGFPAAVNLYGCVPQYGPSYPQGCLSYPLLMTKEGYLVVKSQ
jgi:hypothetical protein